MEHHLAGALASSAGRGPGRAPMIVDGNWRSHISPAGPGYRPYPRPSPSCRAPGLARRRQPDRRPVVTWLEPTPTPGKIGLARWTCSISVNQSAGMFNSGGSNSPNDTPAIAIDRAGSISLLARIQHHLRLDQRLLAWEPRPSSAPLSPPPSSSSLPFTARAAEGRRPARSQARSPPSPTVSCPIKPPVGNRRPRRGRHDRTRPRSPPPGQARGGARDVPAGPRDRSLRSNARPDGPRRGHS